MNQKERTCSQQNIAAVVVTYNRKNLLEACIAHILNQQGISCDVLVVDNASTDGSPEKLEETFGDRIKLLTNEKNGCSSGRNLGVQYADGEYLCFLDSDQWVVSSRWLVPA